MPAFCEAGNLEKYDKLFLSVGSLYKPDVKYEVDKANNNIRNYPVFAESLLVMTTSKAKSIKRPLFSAIIIILRQMTMP